MTAKPARDLLSLLGWRQWTAVGLTLLLGFGLTLAGFLLARELKRDSAIATLKNKASDYSSHLQREVNEVIQTVRALGAFFDSSEHVSRAEFKIFAEQMLRYGQAVQALAWVPMVPHPQRGGMVAAARQAGLPQFQITEQSALGSLQTAGDRGVYYPIYFVEPWRGNEPALGFDVGSNPNRTTALNRARDTGQMVVSGGLNLARGPSRQTNFAVFQPIYDYGTIPATVQARRQNLKGFVAGVFRIDALVEAALADVPASGINFTISDPQAKGPSQLHFHPSRLFKTHAAAQEAGDQAEMGQECVSLQVADHNWTVVFQATPLLVCKHEAVVPWVVLVAGLVATLALFLSVLGLVRRGVALNAANQQLKGDLAGRRQMAKEKALFAEVVNLINNATDRRSFMKQFLASLQAWAGCEAVGIRLREGNDCPYYESLGFSEAFIKMEHSLCSRDENGEIRRDANNEATLECMCGNVLEGRVDPTKSFFTNGGSFWSGSTTDLLATTTGADRLARTRNRCNQAGYESLALVPLRAGGKTFGLIQLNDKRRDCFSEEIIAQVERVANNVASYLAKFTAEKEREDLFQQWRLALDAARLGWWHYDPVTRLAQWDDRYAEIFQAPGREGATEGSLQRPRPEDLPRVWERMEAALDPRDPRPCSAEFRLQLPDGSILWVEARGQATFRGEGEDRHAVSLDGTVADITERKQGLERLARSEERYRLLAENTLDVIWTMNLGLEFTYVNHAILGMAGFSPGEWIGTKLSDHCGSEAFAMMAQIISDELAKGPRGTGVFFETVMRNKKGEYFAVEIHGKVIYDDQGRPVALQGATRDISARKMAEEARQKSEEQFRIAFENAPEGMALVDEEGRFFRVNPRLCEILGYPEAGLLGHASSEFTHPDDRSAGLQRWSEIFAGKAAVNRAEKRLLHRDGHTLWVMISNASIKNSRGEVQYVLSHIYDITKRKQAEEALRSSEAQFRALVENAPIAILIQTEERIVYINNEGVKAFGALSREELLGQPVWDRVPRRFHQGVRDRIRKVNVEGRSVEPWEYQYLKLDGTPFYVTVLSVPIHYQGKWGALVFFRDITERKRSEEERSKLEAQLRQAQKMEAIGTLAGGIAHDFNNILSAILGYAELIRDTEPAESENVGHVEQILAAINRAKKLVEQILTFGRKAGIETRPVDLNRRVREAVHLIRQTIPKMVSIELHLAEGLHPIQADPGQLEQIVVNLATNAKDAMPEGGRLTFETSNVHLDADYYRRHFEAESGEYVRLEVSDTGQGMSKEVLDQIFDPFFTTKEVGRGTGLGLFTTYGIVKAHGGFVYCYSEPGQGTTFRIYFPALRSEGAVEPPEAAVSRETVIGGEETLLLVDDEHALRILGERILSREGYRVLTAGSGEDALDIYRERADEIDLVILDVNMPGMGGHRCLQEILKLNPGAKILIASGYSANGQLKDTLAAGAAGYIAKPYERIKLLRMIRETLDMKKEAGN